MIFINKDHSGYLRIGVNSRYEKYFINQFEEKYKIPTIVCYNGAVPN